MLRLYILSKAKDLVCITCVFEIDFVERCFFTALPE